MIVPECLNVLDPFPKTYLSPVAGFLVTGGGGVTLATSSSVQQRYPHVPCSIEASPPYQRYTEPVKVFKITRATFL